MVFSRKIAALLFFTVGFVVASTLDQALMQMYPGGPSDAIMTLLQAQPNQPGNLAAAERITSETPVQLDPRTPKLDTLKFQDGLLRSFGCAPAAQDPTHWDTARSRCKSTLIQTL